MLAGMRLLATDLDGTLVFHHAVGQADAEALLRWREAGNLLVLATGRSVNYTSLTTCPPTPGRSCSSPTP